MASTSDSSGELDSRFMGRALDLAERGLGWVEPNPMVGCVLVKNGVIVGEGWHQRFGGPHAEIEALRAAGPEARGADAYVTLEPCCHEGKTGPCTRALIEAGVSRVIVGCEDPNPQVAGQGVAELQSAGIAVSFSGMAKEARDLIAPFQKLVMTGRPWVIAKWAMTLDGKIATRTGSSQWISGEQSRAKVHELRGRVDGIMVGRGTVEADDPLLTARPTGPRQATRIVLDTDASLSCGSQLVQTFEQAPLIVAVGENAPQERKQKLEAAGVQLVTCPGRDRKERLASLLDELGDRQMTNLLIEGGAEVLGTCFDIGAVDELLVFIAPKVVGGDGIGPIAGHGIAQMEDALRISELTVEQSGDDLCFSGRLGRDSS